MNLNQKEIPSINIAPLYTEALHTIDGKTLLTMDLPELKMNIEPFLPQGLFILGGDPKVGKSWLALQMSCAVASGNGLFGFESAEGSVL